MVIKLIYLGYKFSIFFATGWFIMWLGGSKLSFLMGKLRPTNLFYVVVTFLLIN